MGLALRGRRGTSDLHRAVDCLRDYQFLVFLYFISGWIIYFISNTLLVWIYFKRRVAVVATFPLGCFILAILWYSYDITRKLRLREDETVLGKIDHFQPYEFIGDLDHGLHTSGFAGGSGNARAGDRQRREQDGYCPVNEALDEALKSKSSVGRMTTL